MAMPAQTGRINLVGRLGNAEVFSTGFAIDVGDGVVESQADWEDMIDAIYTQFSDNAFAALAAILDPQSAYTAIRGYYYAIAGAGATYQADHAIAGGSGTSSRELKPAQTSLVASLRTGRPGRSYRGRMFLPATGVELTQSTFAFAGAEAISEAMADFFSGINRDIATAKVHVVSDTRSTSTQVTYVSVDHRIDIQRRRADALSTSSPVITPVVQTPGG